MKSRYPVVGDELSGRNVGDEISGTSCRLIVIGDELSGTSRQCSSCRGQTNRLSAFACLEQRMNENGPKEKGFLLLKVNIYVYFVESLILLLEKWKRVFDVVRSSSEVSASRL